MTKFEQIYLVLTAITTVGTISVVALAIFSDTIKKWFYKPSLETHIAPSKPFIELISEPNPIESGESKMRRIYLKIINNGKLTALNSVIIIEKVFKRRHENQTFFIDKTLIPSTFRWEDDLKGKHITRSIPHYIEIARIQSYLDYSKDEEHTESKAKTLYRLYLAIENVQKRGTFIFLGKGTFILPILIYSDNMDSPHKCFIEIFWNGDEIVEPINESDFYVKPLSVNDLPNEIKENI
jgi:hypothetical protein